MLKAMQRRYRVVLRLRRIEWVTVVTYTIITISLILCWWWVGQAAGQAITKIAKLLR